MYVSPISERLLSGRFTPAIRAICRLALPLLVTLVLADDEPRFVAADDPALLAHRLDRRSYLHDPFRLVPATRLWLPGPPPLPRRGVALTRQASAHSSRTADGSNYRAQTAARMNSDSILHCPGGKLCHTRVGQLSRRSCRLRVEALGTAL